MAVVSAAVAARIMSEMARAAAKDESWQSSEHFKRRLDEEFDRMFPKRSDVVAIPCHKRGSHDT